MGNSVGKRHLGIIRMSRTLKALINLRIIPLELGVKLGELPQYRSQRRYLLVDPDTKPEPVRNKSGNFNL